MDKIYLRNADWSDVDLLFGWVNDSDVRKNSFMTERVDYEDHKKWYKECLENINVDIFILYVDDLPVGQIRLNYNIETAIIDYSIDRQFRGMGFGDIILKLMEQKLVMIHPEIYFLMGSVKLNNLASRRTFEKNGYKVIRGDGYVIYEKKINVKIKSSNNQRYKG